MQKKSTGNDSSSGSTRALKHHPLNISTSSLSGGTAGDLNASVRIHHPGHYIGINDNYDQYCRTTSNKDAQDKTFGFQNTVLKTSAQSPQRQPPLIQNNHKQKGAVSRQL